jgi:hypothetical protein
MEQDLDEHGGGVVFVEKMDFQLSTRIFISDHPVLFSDANSFFHSA